MTRFRLGPPLLFVFCSAGLVLAQSAPAVFFTDLDSGPNTGGESNQGTILTIYGKGFGATQGGSTVTLGGGSVAAYLQWGAVIPGGSGIQKISVAIGPAAKTGPVVVLVNGVSSNSNVTFAVRPGNIYCVSPSGRDSASGKFPSNCWLTAQHARDQMAAGDTAYFLDGFAISGGNDEGFNYSLWLDKGGTANKPKAYVAYPGAKVTFGGIGLGSTGIHNPNNWITLAGIQIRNAFLLRDGGRWRIVGNDISCPSGDSGGGGACHESGNITGATASTPNRYLGNVWHDVSSNVVSSVSKLYHATYFDSGAAHVELGWNTWHDNQANRALQLYDSSARQADFSIHDNLIYNNRGTAMVLSDLDTSTYPTVVYNNIIYHVGLGPGFADATNWQCIVTAEGSSSSNPIDVYNNTLYDCGPFGSRSNAAIEVNSAQPTRLRNNIVYQLNSRVEYLNLHSGIALVCDSNLFFGNGRAPSQCTHALSADPLFVNPGSGDLHLQPGSPAIAAGPSTGIAFDFDGVPRPGAAYSLGACEPGTLLKRPGSPANLKITVEGR